MGRHPGRGHQNKFVAKQVLARVAFDEVFFVEIVHPVEIGRHEDIGGSSLLDLFGKGGGSGIRGRRQLARFSLPLGDRPVERVLEACGGENPDRLADSRRIMRKSDADEDDEPEEQASDRWHGVLSLYLHGYNAPGPRASGQGSLPAPRYIRWGYC